MGRPLPVRTSPRRKRMVEWPSLLLCAFVYAAFAGLTLFHDRLPAIVFAALGAPLLCLQASMQHEFIHGHPTRWHRLNKALAAVPLSLWLPFERYRMTHLVHHRDETLTDPYDDPESFYWSAGSWTRLGPAGRAVARFHGTLAGRLLIGPAWNIARFLVDEARACRAGRPGARAIWLRHALAASVLLVWIVGVCGIHPLFYCAALVYPSTSILLLRSFAEHRAAHGVSERTAIVENAPILGFLFLYNNLHAAHHDRPTLPWYALPAWYRTHRERLVVENGGLVYNGYAEVARRYLLVSHDVSVHPDEARRADEASRAAAPDCGLRTAPLAAILSRFALKNASDAARFVS